MAFCTDVRRTNVGVKSQTTHHQIIGCVSDVDLAFKDPEWPAFRGANRDGIQRTTRINTDWKSNPPKQLWKVPVGPGWASFLVAGKVLFTQEQRGERECVVCYSADDGKEIWIQELATRFEDPLGGPGPRSTPTLFEGSLYSMGASGHVIRLDPATGDVIWQTDVREITSNQTPPMWGFSCSPLVTSEHVIVYAAGKGDKGTLALDRETGELKWSAPAGEHSYASPSYAKSLVNHWSVC